MAVLPEAKCLPGIAYLSHCCYTHTWIHRVVDEPTFFSLVKFLSSILYLYTIFVISYPSTMSYPITLKLKWQCYL